MFQINTFGGVAEHADARASSLIGRLSYGVVRHPARKTAE